MTGVSSMDQFLLAMPWLAMPWLAMPWGVGGSVPESGLRCHQRSRPRPGEEQCQA